MSEMLCRPNFLTCFSPASPASLPDGSGCWIRLIRKPVTWQQVSHLLLKYTESGYETVLTAACARQGSSTTEWVNHAGHTTRSRITWFVSFIELLAVWCCIALNFPFVPLALKDGLNISVTDRPEFTVCCKNSAPIILCSHWSHAAHRFSHHVMETHEWGVDFLHSSSYGSGW
jgi:hypothetical protein